MFHPAAALHQPKLREAIEEDFRRLREIVKGAAAKPDDKSSTKPADSAGEQLSLF
jgi:hypothetical protein